MPTIDDVVKFITDELNIGITEKNKELIIEKFYEGIKNKINWYLDIDDDMCEDMITNEEYNRIKTLSPETDIYISGRADIDGDKCKLKDILFKNDPDTLKELYDEGEHYYTNRQIIEEIDLMHFLFQDDYRLGWIRIEFR